MAQDGNGVNGNNGRRSAGNGGVYTGSQQSMYYRGPDGKIYMHVLWERRSGRRQRGKCPPGKRFPAQRGELVRL